MNSICIYTRVRHSSAADSQFYCDNTVTISQLYTTLNGSQQCRAMQRSAVQCSAVPCSAVQCSAVQCSAVQRNAVQCSLAQCSAVQCRAVQYSVLQCRAVQYSVLQCRAVQYIVLQCRAVQYSVLQCRAVQYGVLQCSAGGQYQRQGGATDPSLKWENSKQTVFTLIIILPLHLSLDVRRMFALEK